MRSKFFAYLSSIFLAVTSPAFADFGDADFPIDFFDKSPKSYHDVWCREMEKECRVRFQGQAMWVEGQGGIDTSQYIILRYRYEDREHYNYLTYRTQNGIQKTALFLISNNNTQRDFFRAFQRWKDNDSLPIPNYKLPGSQGPQDTQGRSKGLNPY